MIVMNMAVDVHHNVHPVDLGFVAMNVFLTSRVDGQLGLRTNFSSKFSEAPLNSSDVSN